MKQKTLVTVSHVNSCFLLLLLVVVVVIQAATEQHVQEETELRQNQELRAAIVVNQLALQNLLSELVSREPSCPYPYKKVLDECFFVSRKKLSWQKARQHCLGMAGDLATPMNLYALNSFIILTEGPFDSPSWFNTWVGCKRRVNGSWKWLNNATLNPADWHPNHPHSRPADDCIFLHNVAVTDVSPVANWACSLEMNFACQYKLAGE